MCLWQSIDWMTIKTDEENNCFTDYFFREHPSLGDPLGLDLVGAHMCYTLAFGDCHEYSISSIFD